MASLCIGRSKDLFNGKTWQPFLQSVRHGRRINVRHPRPPHYERALFEALCKPIYAKPLDKLLPLSDKCKKTEEEDIRKFKIDNPYERILANNLLKLYEESKLIAICHKNSIKSEDRFNMVIRFKRDGMTIKEHGKHVTGLALKGTKYEPVLHLCQFDHLTIFCKEPKVKELMKNLKKTPQLLLLAGIIEDYFANVNQIQEYVRLKDISFARAELVSVLNSGAQSIVTGLNQHQSIFVANLDQYVSMKNDMKSDGTNKNESISSSQTSTSMDSNLESKPL